MVRRRDKKSVKKDLTPPTADQKTSDKKKSSPPSLLSSSIPSFQIGPYGAKKEKGAEEKNPEDRRSSPHLPQGGVCHHYGRSEGKN